MNRYVKRFIYVDDSEERKINPLFYPFLGATFFYGVGFVFFGWSSGVNRSSLFIAMTEMHVWIPEVWGFFAILSVFMAFVLILTRTFPVIGSSAAIFGFLVWLFACWVYILGGYWLMLLTVAIPNLSFWLYYFVRVKWYSHHKEAGTIKDPK